MIESADEDTQPDLGAPVAAKSKKSKKSKKSDQQLSVPGPVGTEKPPRWDLAPVDAEIVIGLVGPIGVDIGAVAKEVEEALKGVKYTSALVQLTDLLSSLGYENRSQQRLDERYQGLMDDGNDFVERIGNGAAMAALGVAGMKAQRAKMEGESRRAFIFRQLKRPEEVRLLRSLHGDHFFLVAALGERQERIDSLALRIAESANDMSESKFLSQATELVERDDHEEDKNGQNLRDTFKDADLFVDPSNAGEMRSQIRRFIDLMFGQIISTPTRDEYGMFVAKGSAMLSGSLARQVGAAVVDESGAILSTGTNEVPRAGGGVYWEGDIDDRRDHVLEYDSSDRLRHVMLSELLEKLRDDGWFKKDRSTHTGPQLADLALHGADPPLAKARVNAVIEYIRAAHAEQAALLDAARRGVSVKGTTLLVTTFPCHECTRLILLAGIARVVYVEPYPKSLATRLYQDSVSVEGLPGSRIPFEAFQGIAPRQYSRLFSMEGLKRKDERGNVLKSQRETAQLRSTFGGLSPFGDQAEQIVIDLLNQPG